MQVKSILGLMLVWALVVFSGFSVTKHHHIMGNHSGPDKVAADEQPIRFPALDLEDLCKRAKNPKCEAVVDNFCMKSCNATLCAEHGSIRGMCRLMCEAEDLPPPCLKMGSSTGTGENHKKLQPLPFPNQEFNQKRYPLPQN